MKFRHKVHAEIINVYDEDLVKFCDDCTSEGWTLFSKKLSEQGAFDIDVIDWSTDEDHLAFSVCVEDKQKVFDFLDSFQIPEIIEEDEEETLYQCTECRATDLEGDLEVNEVGGFYICPNCCTETMKVKTS